jgi:hypothetical protein
MTIEYVIQQLNNIMGPDFEWKYMPENLKFSDEIDVDVYIITHATNPVYICTIGILPLMFIVYKILCYRGDKKDGAWLRFNAGINWCNEY